jgi:F420-non-reducing hydrogenase iron-sulfur subunit
MNFEPKIIGFLCEWCSYQGADLAGTSRLQYPESLISIRVMCSSRISPQFVIKAFQKGADGVLLAACHIGDCHYQKGNFLSAKWVAITRELLDFIGIDKNRLRFEFISAAEGQKFARVVSEFTRDLKQLGPLVLKKNRRFPAQ